MGRPIDELKIRDTFRTRFIELRRVLRKLGLIGKGAWPNYGTELTLWFDRCVGYKLNGSNSDKRIDASAVCSRVSEVERSSTL